jgi:hypothetical protein
MARPRRDGKPPREPIRCKLTEFYINNIKPADEAFAVWDTKQRGLALLVQKSGHKAWKAVYSKPGRGARWYHIGNTDRVGLAAARKKAAKVMLQVMDDRDPHAERMAKRGANTFAEVAATYVQHAKTVKKNRSAEVTDKKFVKRLLVPRWGKLSIGDVTRRDVKALMALDRSDADPGQWGAGRCLCHLQVCHRSRPHRGQSLHRGRAKRD